MAKKLNPYCSVSGCGMKRHALGLCKHHYNKQYEGPVELRKNPNFELKQQQGMSDFETINKIPVTVLFKRFKNLDNIITL